MPRCAASANQKRSVRGSLAGAITVTLPLVQHRRTYTKWDPKDDFEFFGLQTTTYQVQHVKDLPSTALMIAALFDHLESLGCTQDKTVFADSDK